MRILYLPDSISILLCFIIWPILQVSAALLCKRLPGRFLNPGAFYFRTHHWEKSGRFYERFLRIKKWKGLLPDGGAAFSKRDRKKRLTDLSRDKTVKDSSLNYCRAELTHLLRLPPFIVCPVSLLPPFCHPHHAALCPRRQRPLPLPRSARYNRPAWWCLLCCY
jgi:glycosyl-4,4'-diaponeurosporenoate acyltransferase